MSEVEAPSADGHRRAHAAMGTLIEVALYGTTSARADAIADGVFADLDRLEQLMSEWRPGTQLYAVNAAAGSAPVVVDEELYALLERALAFSRESAGAFDPTFAALWGLWTFGDDGIHQKPSDTDVEARRALIGWQRVVLDPATKSVFLPARGMKLGLGGIAKGYAIDRAAARVRAGGVVDFMVRAGGDLYVGGHPGGAARTIGIRDPRSAGFFATVPASEGAVSTSGDYERFFIDDGVRYHHIIDPRTARPARGLRSVTLFARDAVTSDALTKVVFVLGAVRGMALLEARGLAGILVDDDSRVLVSSRVPRGLSLRAPTAASP